MTMRVFEWGDGFTPYSATVDGVTLTERQGDTVERVSRLVRRPEWDGHPNADDYPMTDDFACGEVDGIAAAWIDRQGYELAPSGDFDCCATGEHDATPATVTLDDVDADGQTLTLTVGAGFIAVRVAGHDGGYQTVHVNADALADAVAFVVVESGATS